jgi:hypothetical protein
MQALPWGSADNQRTLDSLWPRFVTQKMQKKDLSDAYKSLCFF